MRGLFFAVGFLLTLGACAPPPVRETARPPNPFREAQQAPLTAAPERAKRYYVDEQGVYWDDSGRKLAAPPG